MRDLIDRVFGNEPKVAFIRLCMSGPCLGARDDEVQLALDRLAVLGELDVDGVVRSCLEHLCRLIPPSFSQLDCHIYPGIETAQGGGATFGPGKLLIAVPISEDWAMRVRRNCAHEYSHAVRMAAFPAPWTARPTEVNPLTVRESLIFEGLAETLAQDLYPCPPLEPPPLTEDEAAAYWAFVTPHLDETGTEAYFRYIVAHRTPGVRVRAGYLAGTSIVRAFLIARGLTSSEAQLLSWAELDSASTHGPLAQP